MNKIKTLFQGFVIGAGMSIPGFSGGTLAIILGIYNKLIYSVANLLKDIKKSGFFLIVFGGGGILGFFTAAKIITMLLASPAEVPLRYAFLGAAAAAMLPVFKKTNVLPFTLGKLMLIITGIATAALISYIPPISLGENAGSGILLQIAGGFILAAALVLPGISGSQMLVTLGLYDQVMVSISDLQLLRLIPLALGCAFGIIATAKILSNLLEKSNSSYLVIIGFMFFSIKDMIPYSANPTELIIGLMSAFLGGAIISLCLSKEINKTERSIL